MADLSGRTAQQFINYLLGQQGADSLSVRAVQERMGTMKITTFAAIYIGSYESQS